MFFEMGKKLDSTQISFCNELEESKCNCQLLLLLLLPRLKLVTSKYYLGLFFNWSSFVVGQVDQNTRRLANHYKLKYDPMNDSH